MVETLSHELLALHAFIGLLVILWSLAENKLPSASLMNNRLAAGLLLGLVSIATMVMAVEIQHGFLFDLRHALIATSGLLFGPLSAVITAAMSGAVRTYYGGGGMAAGLFGIAISNVIGSLGHLMLKGRIPDVVHCIGLAAVVSLGALLNLLAIAPEIRNQVFSEIWLPLVSLTFTSTLFTAYFLAMEFARRKEQHILELHRDMVNALPDCLNVKDLNGRFVIANRATSDLMKAANASDLIDKSDFDFYPAQVAAGYREQELAVLEGGVPQRFEQLVDFKDGKIGWLETVKVPLRNKRGELTALVTYNRDSTAMHELNEKKEQFIATMSHEIRTPLTSICGSLRLVAKVFSEDLPPKASDMIARADRNAQHLSELINNLLDFDKFNSGQMDFTP
jgi:PAS domain S-box-containing protein